MEAGDEFVAADIMICTVPHTVLCLTLYCASQCTVPHTVLCLTVYCASQCTVPHTTVPHTVLCLTLYCASHCTVPHTVIPVAPEPMHIKQPRDCYCDIYNHLIGLFETQCSPFSLRINSFVLSLYTYRVLSLYTYCVLSLYTYRVLSLYTYRPTALRLEVIGAVKIHITAF